MKTCPCQPTPGSRLRRCGETTGWLLSGATLVMIPKCPACLAAYAAVATGIGISFSTAAYIRVLLIVLCVGSMSLLVFNKLKHRLALRSRTPARI